MDSTATIKLGQLNLGRGEIATIELQAVAEELGLHFVLVQEQFHQARGILQVGMQPGAGLYVGSPDIGLSILPQMCNEYCFVCHIGRLDLYLVSAYFKYSDPIDVHLHHLEVVLGCLRGKKVIIGVDSNAHSPLWFCEKSQYVGRGYEVEYRRNQVESFVNSWNLNIINEPNQPCTFSGARGESNLDLTLSTNGVYIDEWCVHDGVSSSDHRLITFTVHCIKPAQRTAPVRDPPRFRERGVDWEMFRAVLQLRMGCVHINRPASILAGEFTEVIVRTARDTLGERRPRRDGGYEWWTPELERMRKQHCKARRAWQGKRCMGGRSEELAREAFHRVRARYRKLMEETQRDFFRQIAESGNRDPWGQAYRLASGRVRPPANVVNGISFAGSQSEDMATAMKHLMHALCPDDQVDTDTEYHRQVRVMATVVPTGKAAALPDPGDLWNLIRTLPNTSPGLDGLSARIVKNVWSAAPREFYLVFAKCVEEGIFPKVWKDGRLIVLPKGNGKPLTDPKAYRPIMLLPTLGKLLERVILRCAPGISRGISEYQHGFSPGRSTVTALRSLLSTVKNSKTCYVQAVFLDIAGAFDNAWWPMILVKAKGGGCPPNIYRMLVDYFVSRRVGLIVGDRVEWKVSTMGCPQGSVLGPTLWNLLMDDLLRLPLPDGVSMVAYADDVTILIEANSRAGIESKAQATLNLVKNWGGRNRLEFSSHKSLSMTIKGKFQRPPVIRFGSTSIKNITATKVLGVTIDSGLSFVQHAADIGDRATKGFAKMSRVSTSSWGIRYSTLKFIYKGIYVSTLTYAAECWYERACMYTVRSALLRSQRSALVLLTKAYRSTSTAALSVLGGVLPADLEVIRAGRMGIARMSLPKEELRKRKREIWDEVVGEWQKRWMNDTKGRELYRFFPDLGVRLGATWVTPDHQVSQILSGHGCFRKRLYDMRLKDTSMCDCGAECEDVHHVLWECPQYNDLRCKMMDGLDRPEHGPVYYGNLVSGEANFSRLREFAHGWFDRRNKAEANVTELPDGVAVPVLSCPEGGE